LERLTDYEPVLLRIGVWSSAVSKTLDDPLRLLVGWGPQSTARQLEQSHMQALLTGTSGNVEGAFDSTIIGIIVEYGIVFAAIILGYIAFWFFHTWRYLRATGDKFAQILLLLCAAFISSHIVQQFGLSPSGLIALQLFGFLTVLKKSPQMNGKGLVISV
jgi:hypothetical protein